MLLCLNLLNCLSLLYGPNLLYGIINESNSISFSNTIGSIKELVASSTIMYKNTINIDYEQRIKSEKRIIEKLNKQRIPHDIYGLRIIYEDSLDINNYEIAYAIKNLLYNNFNSVDCFYDDYIKYPKINNYQSLHIYIVTNILIEVQIRNSLMHYNAINGTASNYH
jgi:(p)ppGpp synthase/HD superfamily hydrolase